MRGRGLEPRNRSTRASYASRRSGRIEARARGYALRPERRCKPQHSRSANLALAQTARRNRCRLLDSYAARYRLPAQGVDLNALYFLADFRPARNHNSAYQHVCLWMDLLAGTIDRNRSAAARAPQSGKADPQLPWPGRKRRTPPQTAQNTFRQQPVNN